MKSISLFIIFIMAGIAVTASAQEKASKKFVKENVRAAAAQTSLMLTSVGEPIIDGDKSNYPRTVDNRGRLLYEHTRGWTIGFFPGSLWHLYELTEDKIWKDRAEKWTLPLAPLKTMTSHHDIGFMIYCSFGNAERLASKSYYKEIIVTAAKSLITRYNEKAQVIKSWNYRKAWNDTVEMFYPVIIDNMMNLELLCEASKITGDQAYLNIAIAHANTTLKNHFRDDFSTYHVVDYNTDTGQVNYRATDQGYSNNSTWARGQAWAVYGFTMMYRYTKDPAYLNAAKKAANYFLANLPEDMIPLWDFNAGQKGYTPEHKSNAVSFKGENNKDASAAAIVASALFELGGYAEELYVDAAIKMLHSLCSPKYRANNGENNNFLLMHCVGSIPHQAEVDKPLVYADYYLLEALVRYNNYLDNKN